MTGRRIKLFCAWWAGMFLYYWWLIGESKLQQFCAGAVIGFGTAWAVDAVRQKFGLQFRVKAGWLMILMRRVPGQVLKDLGLLTRALWEGLTGGTRHRGLVQEVAFEAGTGDAVSAGRRALLIAGVSTAPNTYVIGINRQKGRLEQHQLVPRENDFKDKEWPL